MAVVGALAVGGCGGGSGGDETIAKAEFVAQADAICMKAQERRNDAVTKSLKTQGQGKLDAKAVNQVYVDSVLPALVWMSDKLEQLDEPASGAETATAFVTSVRTGIEEIEANPEYIFSRDVNPFKEAKEKAKALGMKACASF